jgi:uncharacterized membrane protein
MGAFNEEGRRASRRTMPLPPSPLRLVALLLVIALLLALIQFGIVTIAFDKLGLSAHSAFVLLFASLIGSGINLPLFSLRADVPPADIPPQLVPRLFGSAPQPFAGRTMIAMNVGGGLIPVAFSLYLFANTPITAGATLLAIAAMSVLSYAVSRPIGRIGIGMPILLAPVVAALWGLTLDPENSAPLAYVCGTLGVLIGADILRLKDIRNMGVPVAAIGGAGTFDGVFLTGLVAVLLA